jgi:hypothetical protein
MKTRTFTTVGSLHPILFFAGVYIVALFFSIFICSALFYSLNGTGSSKSGKEPKVSMEKQATPVATTSGVVMR